MAVLQGNQNETKPNLEVSKEAEGISAEGLSNEGLKSREATASPSLDNDKLSIEEVQSRLAAPGESVVSKEIQEQANTSTVQETIAEQNPQARLNALLHGDLEADALMKELLDVVDKEKDSNSLN